MVGVTGGGGNFWASENLSGRVHFEGYSPEWRVLSKLSVQPWGNISVVGIHSRSAHIQTIW